MIKKVYIVSDSILSQKDIYKDINEHISIHYKVDIEQLDYKAVIEQDQSNSCLYFLYLSDINVKEFFKLNLTKDINIAIIPNDSCSRVMKSYGISKDIFEAIDDGFNEKNLSKIDLLVCNGEPAFTNIVLGDVHGLNQSSVEKKSFFKKGKDFFTNINNITFKDFTFTTAKEQTIQTAATGVMILEHNVKSGSYNFINDDFSLHDGKLNAFILAPTSIISYIYYLILVYFYSRFSISSIPKHIGVIKTSKLNISSSKPIDFTIDGVMISAKTIELEVLKDSLTISLGRNIQDIPDDIAIDQEQKDTIRTHRLPKGDIKNLLINDSLPLFKKAGEDDFKELFLSLKDSAKLSSIFIVLMVLSTLLATTGLFQSSAPVIIGAMILAPLMSPIVSLAMGVVRGEIFLIENSSKTLAIGIATALFFSCIYTYFMPLDTLTTEMKGRLNPNILDLMVAIISGIAGAYANSKSEVAKSLAGVAIAVALVPPLSVTGIAIGWGDLDMIYGSFLLFITNLVGITLAASLTFIVLGYAPINRAKKGIVYSSVVLAIVTIPLIISFGKVVKQNELFLKLDNKVYIINSKTIKTDLIDIDLSKDIPSFTIETKSQEVLEKNDLQLLKKEIEDITKQKINLEISTKVVL